MTKPVLVFHVNGYVHDGFIESVREKIAENVNDEYHIIVTGNHLSFASFVPAAEKGSQRATQQR